MTVLKYGFFFLFLLWIPLIACSQLTIQVTSVPAGTPPGDNIYLAGNFNAWNPGDEDYKLAKAVDGTYQITIRPAPGNLEFKFTRGSWQKVEGNAQGGFRPNRSLNYSGGALDIDLIIEGWEGESNQHTASPRVHIMDNAFSMPQFNTTRRIWLYLPEDYETSGKEYPVLYMHDGQNLFDKATSFAGEWMVDETLDSLFMHNRNTAIVVGIDNGGANRINEYTPWPNNQYGGGEGRKYADFIVNTLKPHIDGQYRTKADRNNTGIISISLGAVLAVNMRFQRIDNEISVFPTLTASILVIWPGGVFVDSVGAPIIYAYYNSCVPVVHKQAVQRFIHHPFAGKRGCLVKEVLSVVHIQHRVFFSGGLIVFRQVKPDATCGIELRHRERIIHNMNPGACGMLVAFTFPPFDDKVNIQRTP